MKIIEVDEELYRYIASHTQHIGESATDILRRMLNFTPKGEILSKASNALEISPLPQEKAEPNCDFSYLKQRLDSGDLVAPKKVVDRFIRLLSILYSIDPAQFAEATLSFHGRTRIYFAKDEKTLLNHGNQSKPKAVTNTPYWVITNTNSARKRSMIVQIMESMQIPDALIIEARNVI